MRSPKYQSIHALLRKQILDGEWKPGARLPSQRQLAEEFQVTLMTLRQAISELEAEGLVRAAPGKGTFIAERPIDIHVGNLSSFAQQMRAAGVDVETETLAVELVAAGEGRKAAQALETEGELCRIVRRRSVDGLPFSLQHSYLECGSGVAEPGQPFDGESLYTSIETVTGSRITEALESISAKRLDRTEAELLASTAGAPALLSIRTSIDQFGRPYLYDEAVLVEGRCTIAAHRRTERLSLRYDVTQG